jgi:hypothetical protein
VGAIHDPAGAATPSSSPATVLRDALAGTRRGAREDLTIDDIPMLVAGLCSSMRVPSCDWRRHLDLLIDAMRAPR